VTANIDFTHTKPHLLPRQEECIFYHSMTYPEGDSVSGAWDLRGAFDQYIGHYPIRGKTVLDVGTAGGFLAFAAEQTGARVTALDAVHAAEFERLHFRNSVYHLDRAAYVEQAELDYAKVKAGFWYSWHRYRSAIEMVYAPLASLPYWGRRFDVVLVGAILEHLADPVSTIGTLAGLAREAVIIAFTPVANSNKQFMETANDWKNPALDFTFWTLSRGLYTRVFTNLGFSMKITKAEARNHEGRTYRRHTIVARRVCG
jgi:2-polyprenyl-3-methyl-5-hydroxy-6-metoxy-1,4-benzoquinol methylase